VALIGTGGVIAAYYDYDPSGQKNPTQVTWDANNDFTLAYTFQIAGERVIRLDAMDEGGDYTYFIQVPVTGSTLAPPTATTQAATGVTATAATLNGSVNPEGSDTSVSFIYGTDPQLKTGTTTTSAQPLGSGTSAVAVNAALTGLQPGTTYL
jgi:hypothetical protein